MNYLTTKEAAAYLRCHRSLIFTLIRAGKLPSYRVGGKVLLKAEEVDALVVPAAARKSNNPNGKNGTCPNSEEGVPSLTKSTSPPP